MNIALTIPEDIATQLQSQWGDLSQRTLEVLAIEAYKSNIITTAQVQQMLNLDSRWQVEEFLKQRSANIDYTEVDLEQDINTIHNLISQ